VFRDNAPKVMLERLKVQENRKKEVHVFSRAFD
jgi:hypothetical protein